MVAFYPLICKVLVFFFCFANGYRVDWWLIYLVLLYCKYWIDYNQMNFNLSYNYSLSNINSLNSIFYTYIVENLKINFPNKKINYLNLNDVIWYTYLTRKCKIYNDFVSTKKGLSYSNRTLLWMIILRVSSTFFYF